MGIPLGGNQMKGANNDCKIYEKLVWHGLPAHLATAQRLAETSENTARPVPSKVYPERSRGVEGMAEPHSGVRFGALGRCYLGLEDFDWR